MANKSNFKIMKNSKKHTCRECTVSCQNYFQNFDIYSIRGVIEEKRQNQQENYQPKEVQVGCAKTAISALIIIKLNDLRCCIGAILNFLSYEPMFVKIHPPVTELFMGKLGQRRRGSPPPKKVCAFLIMG